MSTSGKKVKTIQIGSDNRETRAFNESANHWQARDFIFIVDIMSPRSYDEAFHCLAAIRASVASEIPGDKSYRPQRHPFGKIAVYNAVYLWHTNIEVIKMSNTNNTTYNIRIDSRIKKEAAELYKSMGMSLSSAVNLFLTQSVIQRRFPIDDVIAEPLGEPPAEDEYNSFESWEKAKEWLNA